MIDFVGTPPFLGIALRVAIVTMHFSHSPHRFIFGEHCFSNFVYSREQLGTIEKLSC